MPPSYGRDSYHERRPSPRGSGSSALLAPVRWLLRLPPLQSWLVVMAVIVGLTWLGLRPLAMLVAVVWLGYAIYTWVAPSWRRRGRAPWR